MYRNRALREYTFFVALPDGVTEIVWNIGDDDQVRFCHAITQAVDAGRVWNVRINGEFSTPQQLRDDCVRRRLAGWAAGHSRKRSHDDTDVDRRARHRA